MDNATLDKIIFQLHTGGWFASKYSTYCNLCPDSIQIGEVMVYAKQQARAHCECFASIVGLRDYTAAARENGAALARLIAVCKGHSVKEEYEMTEDWYVSRFTRYFVPSTPVEDAKWDAAPKNAPVEEVKTETVVSCTTRWNLSANLAKGYFTVVFSEDNEARTLRVTKAEDRTLDGKEARIQSIGVLVGADNTSDYLKVVFVVNGVAYLTKAAKAMNPATHTRRAIDWYMQADTEQRAALGQIYAIDSGNCYRCNRLLTVESSVKAGLGPICAGKE